MSSICVKQFARELRNSAQQRRALQFRCCCCIRLSSSSLCCLYVRGREQNECVVVGIRFQILVGGQVLGGCSLTVPFSISFFLFLFFASPLSLSNSPSRSYVCVLSTFCILLSFGDPPKSRLESSSNSILFYSFLLAFIMFSQIARLGRLLAVQLWSCLLVEQASKAAQSENYAALTQPSVAS